MGDPPNTTDALNARARQLAREGLLDAAARVFRQVVLLDPACPAARSNLGAVALRQGDPVRADREFSRALCLDPAFADARYNRGVAKLLSGDLAGGYPEYRARWAAWNKSRPFPGLPEWTGERLALPVLLFTEQGIGDAVHFARYVAPVRERAGAVVLACSPALGSLLATVPGLDALIPLGVTPPAAGACLPLMDTAGVLGLGPADGAPVPYLSADPVREQAWARRLDALVPGGFRVGVAWRGNPAHALDRERSLAPAALAGLARVPGVTLIALHPDLRPDERRTLEDLGIAMVPPDADWRDHAFAGLAGLMASLDLVISVDTAFAHVAGALGRPVWVLLPAVPDWRWGLHGESTPWYPTMRLFRQETPGGWGTVLDSVSRRLTWRAGGRGSERTRPA
ncbi:glycosyltransferase family 9 protein [Pararhodospirillum oryzae]|uniref:Uncharacterized protein n=1 Tax=Pararhodospirillum oryzae TaxID=478448 RepID=A0A512H3N8_9PROT|nr:glycosyltransferase family 9 protein [Pararhodospirillum oryzae]GEO80075.1 hypothetical protein ROR02_02060 [Pararhodospirillum oryzae]